MSTQAIFKTCTMCATEWKTRDDFLDDKTLHINGYGADFEKLERGLFYFTHQQEGCFSTVVLEARDFMDLYSGKKYTERKTGLKDCPAYCLDEKQLDRCDAVCECAFYREVIHIIRERHSG